MAEKTDDFVIYQDRGLSKNAKLVHGVNPVMLIEKIIREKIQDTGYYKMHCYKIDLLKYIEKAAEVQLVSGLNSNGYPSHFQCLLLKLLQLQPSPEIIEEFLQQKYFKYLTCLALFYARLCYSSKDVYLNLEPFYQDYRKIRFRSANGEVILYHIDELVNDLFLQLRLCSIILPKLVKRDYYEDNGELSLSKNLLEADVEKFSGNTSAKSSDNEKSLLDNLHTSEEVDEDEL